MTKEADEAKGTSESEDAKEISDSDDAKEMSESGKEPISRQEWQLLFDDARRLPLSDPTKVKEFRSKWNRGFQGDSEQGLCYLAASDLTQWRYDQLKSLVKQFLETQPDNTAQWEESEQDTPLRIALEKKNYTMVEILLDVCGPNVLDAALHRGDGHFPTLLHLALSLRSPFTSRIIDLCFFDDPIFLTQDRNGRTPLHLAVTKENNPDNAVERPHYSSISGRPIIFSSYDTARHLILRYPQALFMQDEDGNTPYRRRLSWQQRRGRRGGSTDHSNPGEKETGQKYKGGKDESVKDKGHREPSQTTLHDPVLTYMRTYIMRNFTGNDASTALYRPGEELQIDFVLDVPKAVTGAFLERLGQHLVFESVLRQVVLLKFNFESSQKSRDGTMHKPKHLSHSRRDAARIFSWLRKKGVRKIMKVVVIDSEEPWHSDETVQNALEGFEVETWDWKRSDIPSSVIANTSSVVRDLTLYFSGNEAILEDWCGSEGLANESLFSELRQIRIVVDTEIHSHTRGTEAVNSLLDAVRKARREIPVYLGDQTDKEQSGQDKSRTYGREGWPIVVSSFWQHLRNAFPQRDVPSTKIAIICDGVDVSLPELGDSIVSGKSLVMDNTSLEESPWYISSTGHGTAQAWAIQKLCPPSQMYVAKVVMSTKEDGAFLRSVIKAVNWAMHCAVDIICLGFSFVGTDYNGKELRELEHALSEARYRGITVFCTAADMGLLKGRLHSHLLFMDCITIAAANAFVKPALDDDREKVDFLFEESSVPASPFDRVGTPRNSISGSGIATSVACGFAALLLYVFKLQNPGDQAHFVDLRRGLRNAIRQFAESGASRGYASVSVQAVLVKAGRTEDDILFKRYLKWLVQEATRGI